MACDCHEKDGVRPFVAMDGPRDCHTERSQSDTERQMSRYRLCVESKTTVQMSLFTKGKWSHRCRNKLMAVKGEGWIGEVEIDIYTSI